MINPARELLSAFIGEGPKRSTYMFAPYTDRDIGRSYGLVWTVLKREDFNGSRHSHRPARREIRLSPYPKAGRYTPHQGKRECERRLRQMTTQRST
jgi:hypothetical protein